MNNPFDERAEKSFNEIFGDLANNQVPLSPEAQKVLNDESFDMYIKANNIDLGE